MGKKILVVFNDAPYGSERVYNGLRLALALLKTGSAELKVFLFADSVVSAKRGQKLPPGYYNVEIMLKSLSKRGVEISA